MNAYEARQEARRQRLEAAAENAQREADSRLKAARSMAEGIPFGQPILVGHHSEKRDRSYRARIHSNYEKGFEAMNRAKELEAKAASVGSGGISSDDPDSVEKLRARLAELEAKRVRKVKINAMYRKGDAAGLAAEGINLEELRPKIEAQYSWCRQPFPAYELSNASANIRRIKERIKLLEANAGRESKERMIGEVKLREDADENRVLLFFPGKPSEKARGILKSNGFRWSPTRGAWSRMLSNGAVWTAERVLADIAKV